MTTFFSYDDAIQQIKDSVDIVEVIGEYVNLTKAGVNHKGLCPFHSEKTPSFVVNPARKSFHCFGCGEGGDILSFLMRFHNMGFLDAVKQLAGRYNIALPQKPMSPQEQKNSEKRKVIYQINQEAVDLYHEHLLKHSSAKQARTYLAKRGIPTKVIADFKLGFAPESWDFLLKNLTHHKKNIIEEAGLIVPNNREGHYDRFRNRVLFPIFNASGKAVGFGGRILNDQQPKYLNSPESPVYNKSQTLFGLFQNKNAIRQAKKCLIVEGNFDLIALVANGVPNVVAPLGTALTIQQVRSLKGYVNEAMLVFDGDKAGIKAALRAVPLFLKEELPAKVVVLPENEDPDTFINKNGKQGFEAKLSEAQPLPEFVFARLQKEHGLSLAGKNAIINDLKPIIEAIGDKKIQRSLFISHFSKQLGLSPEQMLQGIPKPAPATTPKKKEPVVVAKLSKVDEHLLGFLIIFPEYLSSFVDAGLKYSIESSSGRVILHHLMHIAKECPDAPPDHLLNFISGPERDFVSERLMAVNENSDEDREEEAQEKINWISGNFIKIRRKELTELINQAQQENDQELLMQLLTEKNKLRE